MGRYGRIGLFRRVGKADRAAALNCLDQVGLAELAHRQISQLSGGQQQRVFLARALAQESEIYLMDEPFAGVDASTELAIVKLLEDLREAGKTVLVVNHDLQSARNYFDMLILLNMRLVAFGPTEEVFTPELLQKTYGGRLTILADVAEAVAAAERGTPASAGAQPTRAGAPVLSPGKSLSGRTLCSPVCRSPTGRTQGSPLQRWRGKKKKWNAKSN